jgi:hypothetical protein
MAVWKVRNEIMEGGWQLGHKLCMQHKNDLYLVVVVVGFGERGGAFGCREETTREGGHE